MTLTQRPSVKAFAARTLAGAAASLSYDAVVGAVGYEQRSQRIPLEFAAAAPQRVGLAFPDHAELAQPHRAAVAAAGYEIVTLEAETLTGWFRTWLLETSERAASSGPLRLAIDVSSLSRKRIASLLTALYTHPVDRDVDVDVLYTPALYHDPLEQPDVMEVHGPVTNWFAGWSGGQNAVVAFIGIGYEEDRALGVFEYLEPGDAWAFVPEGEDALYDEQLRERNGWVFDELGPNRRVGYRVDDPSSCLAVMEGLVVDELAQQRRPVIVPLGPKIFAVCALLVALRHAPLPAVWRISPGAYARPQLCDSNGKLVGISARFSVRPAAGR